MQSMVQVTQSGDPSLDSGFLQMKTVILVSL